MKELKEKLEVIKSLTGRQNISISYASCYGGYKLVYITENNGESDVCGHMRVSRKEFIKYLDGVIDSFEIRKV